MDTLLERMGGASAVIETIELLHKKMLDDPDLAPYLEGVEMEVLEAKQFDFLGRMLDASDYDGPRLRVAHQGLVNRGLGDRQFDATIDHLRAAMKEVEVPEACIDEVIDAFESTRRDVLCLP